MAGAKDIKRRIKSISSTRKITKAMEMISAVKMRRATESALSIRPYADRAMAVFSNLSLRLNGDEHPLLATRHASGKLLYIVISANRGLCGGFNANIVRNMRDAASGNVSRIDIVGIGNKGERALKKFGFNIIASFPEMIHTPTVERARPIVKMMLDGFTNGVYEKAVLVFTDYISTISSLPRTQTLLPVESDTVVMHPEVSKDAAALYTIEPDPLSVLDTVIPRILEMQIYHAVLESRASEESSRMVAMKNASDAAGDMTDSLRRSYNKARQMKITQEISEISAGRLALE
ncbi:MAG: ATP synthase F1 subunit gamma [Candidatus Lloydbacteria bacterium CG22_combo_CG10-13_8_21_14_all_47_15]|uniref:ATP synthase gamma chain n=1 Tax=Candidatus Lloydbacteria bacterium CG22_combo_CG10-13_8_21_14_all_47_15 TaxID=1974635 RepID=A0A2H0CUR8_9BACT|nr:MAG: ATP synthase F1 subunit gamma [Candidatus Lloydbacteria bacterium CG22_combo_CG10-13_8_21_14_all_47_15]